jgi:hypothetical protein
MAHIHLSKFLEFFFFFWVGLYIAGRLLKNIGNLQKIRAYSSETYPLGINDQWHNAVFTQNLLAWCICIDSCMLAFF